jgi:hypothetical protein
MSKKLSDGIRPDWRNQKFYHPLLACDGTGWAAEFLRRHRGTASPNEAGTSDETEPPPDEVRRLPCQRHRVGNALPAPPEDNPRRRRAAVA